MSVDAYSAIDIVIKLTAFFQSYATAANNPEIAEDSVLVLTTLAVVFRSCDEYLLAVDAVRDMPRKETSVNPRL